MSWARSRYSSIRGEAPARQLCFEFFAEAMDALGLLEIVTRAGLGGIAGHQATSPRASHVLRISSSRRATVRRAQPSCSAISSLL